MTLEIDQLEEAHELWVWYNARCFDRRQQERAAAQRQQQPEVIDEDADVSDILKLYSEKKQGSHLLELEFEPSTEGPEEYVSARTGNPTQCWTWKHKRTGVEIKRFLSKSGKSWDTGKLSNYLRSLKECDDKIAYQRAREIIKLNTKHVRATTDGLVAVKVGKGEDKEELVRQWVRCVMFCKRQFMMD